MMDIFGWTKADAMPMGPAGVYQIFATRGVPIGGMMTRMDAVLEVSTPELDDVVRLEDAYGREGTSKA